MFDLLTGKKKRKLSVSEVNPVQAYINEEYSKHAEEQRMVDSFIKKNTFNGGSIMQYSVKLLSLFLHMKGKSLRELSISQI